MVTSQQVREVWQEVLGALVLTDFDLLNVIQKNLFVLSVFV